MLRPFQDKTPRVHETAFVEDSAHVIGDVELGAHSSVWFQCVLRADVNRIRIGHHTNVQDGTIIHVNRTDPVEIGDHVTLGYLTYQADAELTMPPTEDCYIVNLTTAGATRGSRGDGVRERTAGNERGLVLTPTRSHRVQWTADQAWPRSRRAASQ